MSLRTIIFTAILLIWVPIHSGGCPAHPHPDLHYVQPDNSGPIGPFLKLGD